MSVARMSSKNQVVIPKEVREALAVKGGDELLFVNRRGIIYVLPKKGSLVDALRGRASGKLRYPKNYLSRERASW